MTSLSCRRAPLPAPALAFASLIILQIGTALATTLFRRLGAAGTSWITLTLAAACFLAVARPPWNGIDRRSAAITIALGAVTAGVSLTFMASLQRLPLGTASAIEFLGPLSIPLWRARSARALAGPVAAGGGVALLTRPWQPGTDMLGIGLALAAAAFWAAYIVLAQPAGDHHGGAGALAIALPVAAVASAPFGASEALGHLSLGLLAVAAAVALLTVVAPYSLELLALRRMNISSFGTLMSLEPAIGAVIGFSLLGQPIRAGQLAGMALVVAAGLGASRTSGRSRPQTAATDLRLSGL